MYEESEAVGNWMLLKFALLLGMTPTLLPFILLEGLLKSLPGY